MNSAAYIGAIGSVLTAVVGIVRAYHFAESQLPERLQDYIDECRNGLLADRERLVGQLNSHTAKVAWGWFRGRSHKVPEPFFRSLDDKFDTGSRQTTVGIQTRLQDRIAKLRDVTRNTEIELATAHLVQGLDLVHLANTVVANINDYPSIDPSDAVDMRQKAIAKFRNVRTLDPSEFRGFEYSVSQAIEIQAYDVARDQVTEWKQASSTQENSLQTAKAMRFDARVNWKKSNEPMAQIARKGLLRAACLTLEDSRRTLLAAGPIAQDGKGLELGHVDELLGRVRITLGTIRRARKDLIAARGYFVKHGTTQDIARIDALLAEIGSLNPPGQGGQLAG